MKPAINDSAVMAAERSEKGCGDELAASRSSRASWPEAGDPTPLPTQVRCGSRCLGRACCSPRMPSRVAFVAVVVTFLAALAGFSGYSVALSRSAVTTADLLRAVYAADDPRATAQSMLRAAGEAVPAYLRSPSASPTAQASASASLMPSQTATDLPVAPSETADRDITGGTGGRLGLTCYDMADGSACNDALPSDDALKPLRQPGWGTSLCRSTTWPSAFERAA